MTGSEDRKIAISCRGLVKKFGDVHALNGINLDIPAGQSVAIMGPSGSGKSTLLHCLSGVLSPTEGHVEIGSLKVTSLSDAKRSHLRLSSLGFVFQDGQLIPELPASENIALPLMLTGTPKSTALEKAYTMLDRLGISQLAQRRPAQMSGGQMQRVAIARALVGSPAVIFADEPTGALDQSNGHEVMQMLTTLNEQNGSVLILVTHDSSVARWCERLIEIRDGIVHSDQMTASYGGQR